MQTSSASRILTTHVGSLLRPESVREPLMRRQRGEDAVAEIAAALPGAVREIVDQQVAAGVDVVSDGDISKPSFTGYVRYRLGGVGEGETPLPTFHDLVEFMNFEDYVVDESVELTRLPVVVDDVSYVGQEEIAADGRNLAAAVAASGATEGFICAASPGMIAYHVADQHYGDYETYLGALAAAMAVEYEAIVDAGLLLQLDTPDLAVVEPGHSSFWATDVVREMGYAAFTALNLEAINTATANIAPERMRLHLCFGNYPASHRYDVALRDVLEPVLARSRPQAISFEAANPRHAHEWTVLDELAIPEDKILIPGVIDTISPHLDHPELVAERLGRYLDRLAPEQVIAGTDCGFSTIVGFENLGEQMVWLKLRSLREGADLAMARLTAA